MRVNKSRSPRVLLLSCVYILGALGIMATGGGSGGGGGGSSSLNSIGLVQPESPTFEPRVFISGSLNVKLPTLKDVGDRYSKTIKVTWRNRATGDSGSDRHKFSGKCTLNPFIPTLPLCSVSAHDSRIAKWIDVAPGSNRITFEADGKQASVVVERKLPVPGAETTRATGIGALQATLEGRVETRGLDAEAWFEYATNASLSPRSVTPQQTIFSSGDVKVPVSGLDDDTTYYFRMVASNIHGTSRGRILSLATQVLTLPDVTTLPASDVTLDTANISAEVGALNDAATAWFEWGTDSTLTTSTSTAPVDIPFGPSAATIEETLENLLGGTDYYYRVVAMNTAGTSSGQILNFKTFSLPDATTLPAIQIFPREATVSGSVNPNGSDTDTWFQIGFDPEFSSVLYRTSATIPIGDGQDFVPIDHLFDRLVPASRYYYRVTAMNTWGITDSETLSFSTPFAGDSCWAKEYLAISGSREKRLGRLSSLDKTSDGGFILSAMRPATSTQSDSIIKVNSEGGVEWSFDYINGASPVVTPTEGVIKEVAAGRYIEAGAIQDGSSWIAERGADGDIVWQKTYETLSGSPSPWDGIIRDIEVLPDGYIVLGLLTVFKIDTTGNIEWQYQYGGIGNGEVNDIIAVSDGYVLVGSTDSFGAGASDVLIFKLDPDGNVSWNYVYGSSDSEAGRAIAKTTNGFSVAAESADKGLWVLDINDDGSISRQTSYGNHSNCAEEITGIEFTSDGGLLVSAVTGNRFSGSCPIGVRLIKLDSDGAIQWQKIYSSFELDTSPGINLVQEITGGGYLVGAVHYYSITSNVRIALISTHSDGSCLSLGADISTAPNATFVTPVPGSISASLSDLTSVDANIQNVPTHVAIVELVP